MKQLSPELIDEIVRLAETGMGTVLIAAQLGVSESSVSNYANRHRGTRNFGGPEIFRVCCVAGCSETPAEGRRTCWKHSMVVNSSREPLARLMAGR